MNSKRTARKAYRSAMESGKPRQVKRARKAFTAAGGNADRAESRITKGLQAKDARGQLRSAIKSGDKRAVRGATRAVRATNTSKKRQGSALRIKQKMGY